MNDIGKLLGNLYSFMLLLFATAEVALLWAMSLFFICYISSDANEVTFFCKDNYILNIVIVSAFFVTLFALKKIGIIESFKEKLSDDGRFATLKKVMLWIIAIIGFAWVIITQYVPGSDQLDVMTSAYRYGIGETTIVESGGYLDKWPHNIGITTIERCLAFVVGDFNVVFMQLLNVLGIVLIYKKMVDTWERLGGSRFSQICTLGCGILFYPLIMYASFVYGNIWHVTLALIAFDAELDYFDKQDNKYIVKCAIALGLSFLAKGSAIIFLIALVIYAIVRGAMDKARWYRVLIFVVAISVSVELFSVIPKTILSKTTGYEIRNDGIWSLIAMGLQEDGTAPGWYNGYSLNVYYDNGRDAELAEKIARQETFDRLEYLFSDKHHAYEFFSKKIASMWIEPTYQGYWVNQVRSHRVVFPAWLDSFMSANGYTVGAKIFDFFQILIFLGAILWLIFEDKGKFTPKSFLLLCFVGGFTFNLMWETKSQYAITYFIMLFPYALEGYEKLLEKGEKVIKTSNKIVLAYSCAVIVIFLAGYKLDASNCLSKHNEEYNTYVAEWNLPSFSESVFEINIWKSWIQGYQDLCTYYEKILDENGIVY